MEKPQDVVYQLQEYFERNLDPPLPSDLVTRGDFNIFIDGIDKRDIGVGLVRTAVPTAFPGVEPEPPRMPPQSVAADELMSGSPFDCITPVESTPSEKSRPNSMELNLRSRPPSLGTASQRSSLSGPPMVPGRDFSAPGSSSHTTASSLSSIRIGGEFFSTTQRIGQIHSRPSTAGTVGTPSSVAVLKKMKPSYSWNEIVDKENLGVRPGEVEILPKEFEAM